MVFDTNIITSLLLEEVTCYKMHITNLPLYSESYEEYNKIRRKINKNNGADKHELSAILQEYGIVVNSDKFNQIYYNLKSTPCIQVLSKTRGIDSLEDICQGIVSMKIDVNTEVFDKRNAQDFIKS
jgi:hypothetical protein